MVSALVFLSLHNQTKRLKSALGPDFTLVLLIEQYKLPQTLVCVCQGMFLSQLFLCPKLELYYMIILAGETC